MGEDFAAFGVGAVMVGSPFVMIFLFLKITNWNAKKNLLSDSWFVYLGWITSGIAGLLTYEYIHQFFRTSEKLFFKTPLVLITIFQICTLTAILYRRCRLKKEFSLQFQTESNRRAPSLEEACKTAFLISVSTSLLMFGLIAALQLMTAEASSPYGLSD